MRKSLAFFAFTAAAATVAPRLATASIGDLRSMAASAEAELILAIFGAICLILAAWAARRGDA